MDLNNPDDLVDYLILNGAIEPAGIDGATGDITFNFTEKLKEIYPKLYENFMSEFHMDIMKLWAEGFLEIDVADVNPIVRLSEQAFDEEKVSKLSQDLRLQLQSIIDALRIE
jgi:hypothetical protein